jgi:phosphate transport system protein
MNRFYLKELDELRNHFLLMAENSIQAVTEAIEALRDCDVAKAQAVRDKDDVIDQLEVDIDAEASRYLTLRAPVASDVRLITVALKTSHDLERIGDEASSIAKRTIRLAENASVLDLGSILRMAELAVANIREAIDSLLDGDAERATGVPRKDKEIDILNRENYERFLGKMTANPDLAPAYMELVFVSKSLERIGDHAANIAQEIVFLLTGRDIRHTEVVKRSLL